MKDIICNAHYAPGYLYEWYWYYNIPNATLSRFRDYSELGHINENAGFFLGLTMAKVFWWTYFLCESEEMRQSLVKKELASFQEDLT